MARLDTALRNVVDTFEGGWVDNPRDPGGETYRGITRRWHPNWPGWVIIDECKTRRGFPDNIAVNKELDDLVYALYKTEYWDKFKGDEFMSQPVADELFDIAINIDTGLACRWLQHAINLLNNNGILYPDIKEDGKIGKKTLEAMNNSFMRGRRAWQYLVILNGCQFEYYHKNPKKLEEFIGWLSRLRQP